MKRNISLLILMSVVFTACIPETSQFADLSFNGHIISKFTDSNTGCFGTIILTDKNSIDTLKDVCRCAKENERIFDFVQVNDSLYKRKGELAVKIIRKGIMKKFNFPICYK